MNKNEQKRNAVSLDAILSKLSEAKVQLVTIEAGARLPDGPIDGPDYIPDWPGPDPTADDLYDRPVPPFNPFRF